MGFDSSAFLMQYITKTHKGRRSYGCFHSGDAPCSEHQMRFMFERDQRMLLVLLVLVNFVFVLSKILIVVIEREHVREIIR